MLQRLRPLSPHLTEYKMGANAIMSIFHRATGAGLSMLFYGMSGLVLFGYSSNDLKTAVDKLPKLVYETGKIALITPFVYHGFNGIRHLLWDSGRALSMNGVKWSGRIVNFATLLSVIKITTN